MAKLSVDQTLLKAKSHAKRGEVEEAHKLYHNVLQAFPKNGRAQKGLEALRKTRAPIIARSPSQQQLSCLLGHFQNERFADAERLAVSITKEFPKYQFGWKALGMVLGATGRKSQAEQAMQKAVALSPQDANTHNNLGVILQELGRLDEAEASFLQAIALKPALVEGHNNLGVTLKELGRLDEAEASFLQAIALKPEYAEAHNNLGVTLKELGRLDEALASYNQAIALKPDYAEAHNNLGVTLKELGKLDEALASYNQAIALKPDYAEAHFSLGNTLKELGRLDEALASYNQSIALKPNFAEAHNNLGATLTDLGRLEEALASYNQAIELKPDFAEAHNNLGATLTDLGRLDEALASYNQAIASKPDYAKAQHNLVQSLADHNSQNKSSQPIIKVDQEIKEMYSSEESAELLSNEKIIHLIHKCSNIIEKHGLNLGTELTQAYRHDSVDLNCSRHKQIFEKFNIIPEFCFGCYKVQVEPSSIIELIKLLVLFDQIKLPKNNIRKCMVEMRPEVSGFYKGLIYCSSLEEASQIADYVNVVIHQRVGSKLPLVVKRGCSEYSAEFPDYNAINKSGAKLMEYSKDWKLIEKDYDSKNPTKYRKIIQPSLACLSLSDVLIIRNWIDYAKGIGDPSAQLLNHTEVVCQEVYKIAKNRVATYVWQEQS